MIRMGKFIRHKWVKAGLGFAWSKFYLSLCASDDSNIVVQLDQNCNKNRVFDFKLQGFRL